MLTLGRKQGQSIVIGNDIVVTVKSVRGSTVRLSIETPPGVPVYREEVHHEIAEENRRAASASLDTADILDSAREILDALSKEGGAHEDR